MIILQSLIAGLFIMSASLIGVLFVNKHLVSLVHRKMSLLVWFASGVFSVVVFNLLIEAFELGSYIYVGIFSLVGFLIFWIAGNLMPNSHHHHGSDCEHDHVNPSKAKRMLFGDSIHNMIDGIILAPAFAIDFKLGIITTLSIFIHESIQEVSEFFVLKHSGYSTKKAIILNFITSGSILGGILIGLFITGTDFIMVTLLSISAGGFTYILVYDLLRYNTRDKNKSNGFIFSFLFGIILMSTVGFLLH